MVCVKYAVVWVHLIPYLFWCGWLVYLRSIIGVCISAIMDTRSHSSQVPGDAAAAAAGMARLIWWVVAPSRACHHPAHVMSHMMGYSRYG